MKTKTFWPIFTIGVALRVFWINVPPLWYDENFTYILARMPLEQLIAATMGDVHPPLWYFVEWLWMQTDLPAWTVRVPAMLCSIVALYSFRELLDIFQIPERVRVGAMVLMAVLPFQLWYAQEGRMYALVELEVILGLIYMLRSEWLKLFIVAVAMLYTQNYGAFYLAAIGTVSLALHLQVIYIMRQAVTPTWQIIRSELTPAYKTAVTLFFAFVLYLPWMVVIYQQMMGIQDRYWIVARSAGSVLIIIYKLFLTASVPESFFVASYAVVFGVLIVGVYAFFSSKHPAALVISLMAFVPLGLAVLVSVIWQPILLFRACIGISPFLYIIAVWWLDKVKPADVAFPAIAIVPIVIASLYGYYVNVAAMKGEGAVSSMSEAIAYVESHWQDGDVIYVTDDGPFVNVTPYTDLPIYRMPECESPVLGSLSPNTRAALGANVISLDDVPHNRAWVFAPFSPLHPACYEKQVNDLIGKTLPAYVVDDNEWLKSAVYLVEE